MDFDDQQRLIQELQLHQRELELQNEMLREAQLDLAASRDAFASLFDLVPCPVLVIDLDGLIRMANATAAAWLLAEKPLQNKHLFSVIDDADRPLVIERLAEARRGTWQPCRVRVRGPSPGRMLHIEGKVCPQLFLPDGVRLSGTVLVCSDVTMMERERLALEREKHEAQAIAQAKSEFLSLISHEIRTPLSGIIGIADILATLSLPAQAQELIEVLRSSANDLHQLLNDLLDMARIEAGRLRIEARLFDLHELLESVIALFAPMAAAKGLEFVFDYDPLLPRRVVGDRLRLQQILANLINNAIKFTDSGHVVLQASCERQSIRFAVQDTGPGMDSATLGRLFRPFTQADTSTTRRHGGSGLGLAIAHRLVQLMGGELTVNSAVGHGTTLQFAVSLPADQPPALPTLEGHVALVVIAGGTSRLSLAKHLQARRLHVVAAADVPTLQQLLAESPIGGKPFACFVDEQALASPDLWSCCQRLGFPLILTASSADNEHRSLLLTRFGIRDVLPLPLRPSALEACWERLLNARSPSAEESTQTLPGLWRGKTAMVVDDHALTRHIIAQLLTNAGFSVIAASNGGEAERLACQQWPDLAIVDIQLPDIDGYEVARRLREHEVAAGLQPIVMIACSAHASTNDRARALESGMQGWIAKPVRSVPLYEAIIRHLGPPTEVAGASGSP